MTAPITKADLTDAIRWFATRRPPMPGAAKMYQIARQTLEELLDYVEGWAMRRAIFCVECNNLIATTDGSEIKIQHRGRIVIAYGSASIQCEKCGKVNCFNEKYLRRLCSKHSALHSGPTSNAGSV